MLSRTHKHAHKASPINLPPSNTLAVTKILSDPSAERGNVLEKISLMFQTRCAPYVLLSRHTLGKTAGHKEAHEWKWVKKIFLALPMLRADPLTLRCLSLAGELSNFIG